MERKLHLLLTLLLLAICTTGGAEEVTYTVTSTSAVSTTGTAPTGSKATYESTYKNTSQLTSGKKMTLTLSGYAGKKITGLRLSMRSNSKTGAGYLDAKIGTKSFATLGSSKTGVAFNEWYDNKKYSTNYKDVTANVTATAVEDNEDIIIIIGATQNSLYCQSFTLTYEKNSDKPSANLSFDKQSYTATLGKTFNAPELNNPNNVKVAYSSFNENVATVDASTGAVTIIGSGTTKITADYNDENGDYAHTTASYILNVKNPNEIIFSEEGYNNEADVTTITRDDFTATFSKASGKNEPTYYDNGTAVRMYDGNTLTISSTTKEISKIEFTFTEGGSKNYGNLTLSNGQPGTYTPEKNSAGTTTASTWTGLSNSVTFTNGDNQSRIQSIKVTFKETSIATYTAATLPSSNFATSGNDRYATFSSNKVTFFPESDENLTFTTDVLKAYALGDMMELTKLTTATATIDGKEVSGYFVPANTGVLLKVSFDGGTSITYYTVTGKDDVAALTDNMLYPATNAMSELTNCYFYKLAYDDYSNKTGLGFYWGAADGAAFTAKTGGAYLAVPKSSGSAKSGFRFDGTTTGVNTINAKTTTNDVIYNIQGQRVGANYKGLVIVNGKKMMRK